MSFSRTNKIRTQKKEATDQLKELPNRLATVQQQVLNTFKAIDIIGQEFPTQEFTFILEATR